MNITAFRSAVMSLALVAFAPIAHAQDAAPSQDAPAYLEQEDGGQYLQNGEKSGYVQQEADGYIKSARTKSTQPDYAPAPAGQPNEVNGGLLMLIAYAGFWLIALAYMVSLATRARKTSQEVLSLYRRIQELDDRIEDLENTSAR